MHRPAAAAPRPPRPSSEPVTRPAGKPTSVERHAAARPRSPASRRRAAIRFSLESGEAIAAINAAPARAVKCRGAEISSREPSFGQHDAHQIGGVLGAELVHDAGAMHLDGARADPELAAGLLVGSAGGDPPAPRARAASAHRCREPAADIGDDIARYSTLAGPLLDTPHRPTRSIASAAEIATSNFAAHLRRASPSRDVSASPADRGFPQQHLLPRRRGGGLPPPSDGGAGSD